MSTKKLSSKDYDSSADLGPVITRTVKKPVAKKAPAKKAEAKPAESVQARFDDELVERFTCRFIEQLILLFGLPTVLAFCKCSLVWAYSEGDIKTIDFMAKRCAELRDRYEALRRVDEE